MEQMTTVILTEKQIEQKIQRIAYEIVENNSENLDFALVGIVGNGVLLANKLAVLLAQITGKKPVISEITINKQEPLLDPVNLSVDANEIANHLVILIDDVLNSGKTMQYALAKLLEQPTRQIKTVALVDRKHRRYPIRCDYTGLTLSTTLQDRVDVDLENSIGAYLV